MSAGFEPLPAAAPLDWLPNALRRVRRLLLLTLHLLLGVALTSLFPWLSPARRRAVVRRWSRVLLRVLGVQLSTAGAAPEAAGTPLVLASNHVSWLDIFVIDSIRSVRFVAKSEVRGWPVLGWLAARTGTLFIERGRRHAAAAINREIAAAIGEGDTVGLFPEGTTTFGDELRPFHNALFQAAIECGRPLQPVAIRYLDRNGTRSRAAPYVGEQSFVASLWSIVGEPAMVAEVEFGAVVPTSGSDRRSVSRQTEAAIATMLSLPVRHTTPETAHDPAT